MQTLREWLVQHDVYIDERLELQHCPDGSASIVALAPIPPATTVATVPKSLCLSHRSSSLAPDPGLDSLDDLSPSVRLAVHVAHEVSRGRESRWAIYLQHCPRRAVPIGSLWDREEDASALRWLRGTCAEREVLVSGEEKSRLVSLFDNVIRKVITESTAAAVTVDDFLHAYSLVSSRAFRIDAYHSLALVPLADVFNHSDTPHVHLASDHWVCPVCGALQECPHDGQIDGGAAEKGPDSTSGNDTCDMVTELDVSAGEEVYNTYGRLANGRLLMSYGFILEGNEQDEILVDQSFIVEAAGRPSGTFVNLVRMNTSGGSSRRENPTPNCVADILDHHPVVAWHHDQAKLFIDADGRISIGFFALAAQLVLSDPRGSGQILAPNAISAVLAGLLGIAATRFEDSEVGAPDPLPESDLTRCLHQISRVIRRACLTYVEKQEQPHLDCDALLDMADTLSGQSTGANEELALRYLAGERLLVQRTAAQWLIGADA